MQEFFCLVWTEIYVREMSVCCPWGFGRKARQVCLYGLEGQYSCSFIILVKNNLVTKYF